MANEIRNNIAVADQDHWNKLLQKVPEKKAYELLDHIFIMDEQGRFDYINTSNPKFNAKIKDYDTVLEHIRDLIEEAK